MKKINFPLIIGLFLIILISLLYFFPENFTSMDPLDRTTHRSYKTIENGEEVERVEFPPLSPNEKNIFGTNKLGYDLYTRIVYGTESTIKAVLLTVILRFIFALFFGLAAGMGVKAAKVFVKIFNTVFTAIPALIFSYLILSINFLNTLEMDESIIAYAIVLTIVGWGKLANQIQDSTQLIMNEDFIEGEKAIGKSKIKIMLQNVIPHLMPKLVVLFFLEGGLVLFLMAQLAVLSIFLGPSLVFRKMLSNEIDFIAPAEAAWNNELFYGLRELKFMQKYYYWLLFSPALAIFIGVLAFNFTGEGLRIEFEKRNSRVISFLKKFMLMLSPRLYIEQLKRFKNYRKPVILKTLCVVVILVIIFAPSKKSLYEFNIDNSIDHIVELTKEEYMGRVSGYEGGYKAGEYIISTLKDYGIEPYDGENYTQEFEIDEDINFSYGTKRYNILIEEAEIELKDENGNIEKYVLNKDFLVTTIDENYILENPEDEFFEATYKTITKKEITSTKPNDGIEYIFVNDITNNPRAWNHIEHIKGVSIQDNISFIVSNLPSYRAINCAPYNSTHIVALDNLNEKLLNGSYEATIKIKKPHNTQYNSRNIFGIIPGKDWDEPNQDENHKKIIMIGASYDSLNNGYDGNGSAIDASGVAVNLEIANILSKLKGQIDETIVFAFWDAECTRYSGSLHYSTYERLFNTTEYDVIYFDIGDIASEDINKLDLRIDKHFYRNLDKSHLIMENIKDNLKSRGINFVMLPVDLRDSFYQLFDSANIRVGLSAPMYENFFTEKDNAENIDKKKLKEIGQFIIDMITIENLYLK